MNASPLTFEVVGHPEPAGSKKAFMRPGARFPVVVDDNAKSKGWKNVVAQSAAAAMLRERRALIDGPVFVEMVFTRARPLTHLTQKGLSAEGRRHEWPDTKPDVLKLARGVEDACTGIVWSDDARIVKEVLSKEWGEVEGVTVTVAALEGSGGAGTEPTPEGGFRVIPNHTICNLDDRPHSDRSGCPTCHGDARQCVYGRRD